MKFLKKITAVVLFSLVFISCSEEQEIKPTIDSSVHFEDGLIVGKFVQGEVQLLLGKGFLESWEINTSKQQGFQNIKFKTVEIVKDIDQGINKEYFMLIAKNQEKTIKSAIFLKKRGEILFIPQDGIDLKNKISSMGTTVTCVGCAHGCDPRKTTMPDGTDLYSCSIGCGTDCRKTVVKHFE